MRYEIAEEVRKKHPLIHCITNYVTANDVANMILAAGASPIMAESVNEAEEITGICQGLVLNMGMLSDQKLEAMILAGKRGASLGHPVILDPVGVGASSFRREAVRRILREVPCSVIRGNRSEICKVAELAEYTEAGYEKMEQSEWRQMTEAGKERGVDTAPVSEEEEQSSENRLKLYTTLSDLSNKTHAVIVMTGETDLVSDGAQIYKIRNGHPVMSRITGAGCMLDGVIAAYTAAWELPADRRSQASDKKETVCRQSMAQAAAIAAAAMGLCGQLAYEKTEKRQEGTGSFRTYLLDFMSLLDSKQLRGGAQIEIQTIISDSIWDN